MPETQTATVRVRTLDGKVWTIPRENLSKAKLRGAVELPAQTEKTYKEGEFEQGFRETMGFRNANPSWGDMMKDTLSNLRQGVKNEYDRLQRMTGEGKYTAKTKWAKEHGFSEVLLPFGVIAAGIEGTADALEKGGRDMLTPGQRKKGSGEMVAALGQLFMGQEGTAKVPKVAAAATETVGKGARSAIREGLGVSKEAVGEAKKDFETPIEKARKQFEEKQQQQKVKNRSEYEASEIEREAENKKAREKYDSTVEKARKEHAAKVAEQQKLATKRTGLERLKDRYSEQVAQNLDKAEAAERTSLGERWQKFRSDVLGVSKENPNGLLQADLGKVGQAVAKARETILKGSETSVPIFNDIMGKLKDQVESSEGELKPAEGQFIPVDQLRGYMTEINSALYERSLPNDVRQALKAVQEAGESEIANSVKDAHGPEAVEAYKKLKADYSDYMDTWRDSSSNSPLPKIYKLMRAAGNSKMGVPSFRQIAEILTGKNAESALGFLGRKRSYGTNPGLVQALRRTAQELKDLPESKNVPELKLPKAPGFEEAPKVAKVDFLDPKQFEKFDPEQFVKDTLKGRANAIQKWGTAGALIYGMRDLIMHQKLPIKSLIVVPGVGYLLKKGLTNPSFIKWLFKEGVM